MPALIAGIHCLKTALKDLLLWPSRDGAAAHVTTYLKYAKLVTQGGRLWPADFCVTLSPAR
jgi:hypothetical protein